LTPCPSAVLVIDRDLFPTGEVAKKLGAKWKSMSDEDKEVR